MVGLTWFALKKLAAWWWKPSRGDNPCASRCNINESLQPNGRTGAGVAAVVTPSVGMRVGTEVESATVLPNAIPIAPCGASLSDVRAHSATKRVSEDQLNPSTPQSHTRNGA
jgi:hypothetical protein